MTYLASRHSVQGLLQAPGLWEEGHLARMSLPAPPGRQFGSAELNRARLTVARRRLGRDPWTVHRLGSQLSPQDALTTRQAHRALRPRQLRVVRVMKRRPDSQKPNDLAFQLGTSESPYPVLLLDLPCRRGDPGASAVSWRAVRWRLAFLRMTEFHGGEVERVQVPPVAEQLSTI